MLSVVEPVENAVLIPQPDRPKLPLRVPVEADLVSSVIKAEVLGSTANVLLLQGPQDGNVPALGTPIRLRLDWDRQVLTGRIAAHGVQGRFLVTLGERAIRRSKRFPVDLQGCARIAQLPGSVDVRITDLSAGGARVEGINVPIGTEIELRLTPPGRTSPINVLGFVVRAIDNVAAPTVGVAFRLVQPSMDVLGGPTLTPATA
jgi:PilZ domain-containing protein